TRSRAARARSSCFLSTASSALRIHSLILSSFSSFFFSSKCWSAIAIATWVLTCKSWLFMSRITCLIIFSGSSALSIRSFRFARTNVETRSSNAIRDSFSSVVDDSVVGRSSLVVRFLVPDATYQRDRDVGGDSGGYPDSYVAGRGTEGCAHGGSQS